MARHEFYRTSKHSSTMHNAEARKHDISILRLFGDLVLFEVLILTLVDTGILGCPCYVRPWRRGECGHPGKRMEEPGKGPRG